MLHDVLSYVGQVRPVRRVINLLQLGNEIVRIVHDLATTTADSLTSGGESSEECGFVYRHLVHRGQLGLKPTLDRDSHFMEADLSAGT